MSHLPAVSGKDLIKALEKEGYTIHDQKGSHVHLRHPRRPPLTVPHHEFIARGTLRAILRESGLTVEELFNHKS